MEIRVRRDNSRPRNENKLPVRVRRRWRGILDTSGGEDRGPGSSSRPPTTRTVSSFFYSTDPPRPHTDSVPVPVYPETILDPESWERLGGPSSRASDGRASRETLKGPSVPGVPSLIVGSPLAPSRRSSLACGSLRPHPLTFTSTGDLLRPELTDPGECTPKKLFI